jgi:hypothetical protein
VKISRILLAGIRDQTIRLLWNKNGDAFPENERKLFTTCSED